MPPPPVPPMFKSPSPVPYGNGASLKGSPVSTYPTRMGPLKRRHGMRGRPPSHMRDIYSSHQYYFGHLSPPPPHGSPPPPTRVSPLPFQSPPRNSTNKVVESFSRHGLKVLKSVSMTRASSDLQYRPPTPPNGVYNGVISTSDALKRCSSLLSVKKPAAGSIMDKKFPGLAAVCSEKEVVKSVKHMKPKPKHPPLGKHQRAHCEFCDQKFKTRSAMIAHVSYRHKDQKKCPICDLFITVKSKYDMKFHLLKKHKDQNTFRCDKCERNFPSAFNLGNHIRIGCSKIVPSERVYRENDDADFSASDEESVNGLQSEGDKETKSMISIDAVIDKILKDNSVLRALQDNVSPIKPKRGRPFKNRNFFGKNPQPNSEKLVDSDNNSSMLAGEKTNSKVNKINLNKRQRSSVDSSLESNPKKFKSDIRRTRGSHTEAEEPRMFSCEKCSEEFASTHELKEHEKKFLQRGVLICMSDDDSSSEDDDKQFSCPQCNKICANAQLLQKHRETHVKKVAVKHLSSEEEDTKEAGDTKQKSFVKKTGHVKKVAGKLLSSDEEDTKEAGDTKQKSFVKKTGKFYTCMKCNINLKMINDMTQHMKEVHQTMYPFKVCDFCGKVFRSCGPYQAHLKIHQSKVCPVETCNIRYRNLQKMRIHYKRSHPDYEYKCSGCYMIYKKKEQLDKHIAETHPELPGKLKAMAEARKLKQKEDEQEQEDDSESEEEDNVKELSMIEKMDIDNLPDKRRTRIKRSYNEEEECPEFVTIREISRPRPKYIVTNKSGTTEPVVTKKKSIAIPDDSVESDILASARRKSRELRSLSETDFNLYIPKGDLDRAARRKPIKPTVQLETTGSSKSSERIKGPVEISKINAFSKNLKNSLSSRFKSTESSINVECIDKKESSKFGYKLERSDKVTSNSTIRKEIKSIGPLEENMKSKVKTNKMNVECNNKRFIQNTMCKKKVRTSWTAAIKARLKAEAQKAKRHENIKKINKLTVMPSPEDILANDNLAAMVLQRVTQSLSSNGNVESEKLKFNNQILDSDSRVVKSVNNHIEPEEEDVKHQGSEMKPQNSNLKSDDGILEPDTETTFHHAAGLTSPHTNHPAVNYENGGTFYFSPPSPMPIYYDDSELPVQNLHAIAQPSEDSSCSMLGTASLDSSSHEFEHRPESPTKELQFNNF